MASQFKKEVGKQLGKLVFPSMHSDHTRPAQPQWEQKTRLNGRLTASRQ
jgi:hypothetical protein